MKWRWNMCRCECSWTLDEKREVQLSKVRKFDGEEAGSFFLLTLLLQRQPCQSLAKSLMPLFDGVCFLTPQAEAIQPTPTSYHAAWSPAKA